MKFWICWIIGMASAVECILINRGQMCMQPATPLLSLIVGITFTIAMTDFIKELRGW